MSALLILEARTACLLAAWEAHTSDIPMTWLRA